MSRTPTGEISVPCVPANGDVIVRGSVDDGGDDDVTYRLRITTGGTETTMSVTEAELERAAGVTVTRATVGSEIELQFKIGEEDFVTLDGPETVVACDAPGGSYTVVCAQSGTSAQVTVGTLDDGGDSPAAPRRRPCAGRTTRPSSRCPRPGPVRRPARPPAPAARHRPGGSPARSRTPSGPADNASPTRTPPPGPPTAPARAALR